MGAGIVHVTLPGQIVQKQAAVVMLSLLLLCTSPLDTSTAGQPQKQPPSPASYEVISGQRQGHVCPADHCLHRHSVIL